MQDFNGDRPFIIDGNKSRLRKKTKNNDVRKTGIGGRFLAGIVLLCVVVIAVTFVFVFGTFFCVNTPGRKYYAVCFYKGQSKSMAESVRDGLVASGGSGYVVSGGIYRVYGGIYDNKADADGVAAKESDATVDEIGWGSEKICRESYKETSLIGEALEYFADYTDRLIDMTLSLAKGEESALAAESLVSAGAKRFGEYSAIITDAAVSSFFSRAAYSLGTLVNSGEAHFSSSLRYVAQDVVMLRSALDL